MHSTGQAQRLGKGGRFETGSPIKGDCTMTQDQKQMTNELAVISNQAQAKDLILATDQHAEVGGQGALVPVQEPTKLEPVKPKQLTDEQAAEIENRAQEFVDKIKEDPSDWKLGDFIFNLGKEVLDQTKVKVSLYDRKMGDVLKQVSEGDSPVGKDILGIKLQLDLINPAVVGNTKVPFKESAWRFFSKTVNRVPKGDELLRIIAERRETVQSTIDGIRLRLFEEKDLVMNDAVELGVICDQLKEIQPNLQEEIYLGQLIWERLVAYLDTITDPLVKEAVTNLTSDLAMGVVDLQTVDNMNLQTRFGGEMMIRNSRLVTRLVDRTDTILTGAVANALGVRAAATAQMQTLGHLQDVQKAISQTMTDTAKQVGQAAIKGAEMSQKMTVDIDSLGQAIAEYESAFEVYQTICSETIKVGSQASNALSTMNEKFRTRADALTSARQG